MKKINIIKESNDYTKIIKLNKIFKHKCFYIFTNQNKLGKYRIGITVPTKVGKAVIRNKIKRRVKSIIDNNRNLVVKSYDYVIMIRKDILNFTYEEIQQNLIFCLSHIKEKIE